MEYLFIAIFVFLFFSQTFFYGYVLDDIDWQRKMKLFWKDKNKKQFIKYITYGALGVVPAKIDHLITIVFNIINALLITYIFGYFAALLYTIHPSNHQTTIWLNGRRYQIALMFSLLCLINPYISLLAFPIAFYVHPISSPILIISCITHQSFIPLLSLLPCLFFINHYKTWLKGRFYIQNGEIFQKFELGKLIMSIKCFATYWYDAIIPFNIKMFHPHLWGIELEGNRKRMYDLNAHFWLSIAFLLAIHVGVWIVDRSCLKWAVLFDLCLLQWLPIWKNPVQLYANRYAGLAMVFFCVLVVKLFYSAVPYYALYLGMVTLKDMYMYRDVYMYYFSHLLRMPHSMNAHWYAINGLYSHAEFFMNQNKLAEVIMNDCYGKSAGFMWCINHPKPDMIHEVLNKKIGG